MGNPRFEDVPPIKNGGFPVLCVFQYIGGFNRTFLFLAVIILGEEISNFVNMFQNEIEMPLSKNS